MARNYCGRVLDVRPASAKEVRDVQRRVLRPQGPLPGDTDHPPDWLHYAALSDGCVVGACSVGPAGWPHPELVRLADPHWQLRSMAVLPGFRGGTGAKLLAAATAGARQARAGGLWAQARTEAVSLYTRAGWCIVGEQWQKPGVGPHRFVVLQCQTLQRPPRQGSALDWT